MATFFRFQRVRIVQNHYPEYVGRECVLVQRADSAVVVGRWQFEQGWETNLRHIREPGWNLHVGESQIEPLTYLPDAEDLATQENSPDFQIKRPTPVYLTVRDMYEMTWRVASDALRAAVLGEGR